MNDWSERTGKLWMTIVLLSVSLCSCESFMSSEQEFLPVPEQAYDIERHVWGAGSGKAFQTNFFVNVPYKDIYALSYYRSVLLSDGWKECKAAPEWEHFVDASGARQLSTTQLRTHFYSDKNKQLLLLRLSYLSPVSGWHPPKSDSKQPRQGVLTVVYQLTGDTYLGQLRWVGCS